ncbi:hypothetical protein SprV_0200717300 [Sparganum proliferum]
MNPFVSGRANFGLTIHTDKTVVMHQLAPEEEHTMPDITVSGTRLTFLDEFAYLGSTTPNNIEIDGEEAHCISEVIQVFGRLQASAWNRNGIRLEAKLSMH